MIRRTLAALLLAVAAAVALPACAQAAGLEADYSPANAPCGKNADCPSNLCTGTPGWCAEACGASSDCAGGSCITNKANLTICFPSCMVDSDCIEYAATCQLGTDVGGAVALVCAGS